MTFLLSLTKKCLTFWVNCWHCCYHVIPPRVMCVRVHICILSALCLLLAGLAFSIMENQRSIFHLTVVVKCIPLTLHTKWFRWDEKNSSCFTLVTGWLSTGPLCYSFPLLWSIFLSYCRFSSKILDRHLWRPEDRPTWLCWHVLRWFH